MNTEATRKRLQVQGFDFDDATLAEIGPWMRWPFVFCAGLLVVGVVLASATGATWMGSETRGMSRQYGVTIRSHIVFALSSGIPLSLGE